MQYLVALIFWFNIVFDTIMLRFQHSTFNLILDFCEYAEYETLRECCTCLHNYTSRRRQDWSLNPLGGIRRKNVALVQFLHWAKVPHYMMERYCGGTTVIVVVTYVQNVKNEKARRCFTEFYSDPVG